MDSEHGSESRKHSRAEAEAILNVSGTFDPFISFLDTECYEGSRKDSEIIKEGPDLIENSKYSYSLTSSSSDSLSDEFFQVDPKIIPNSKTAGSNASPLADGNAKPKLRRDESNDASSEILFRLEEMYGSSRSTSKAPGVTQDSRIPTMSSVQTPPIQVMERTGVCEPYRIPASVFARPSTPMDWSAASNESLFSIHIGNASFHRDHVFKKGGDSYNAEELSRAEDHDFGIGGDSYNTDELSGSEELYAPTHLNKSELSRSDELYESKELKNSGELTKSAENSSLAKEKEQKLQSSALVKTVVFEETVKNVPYRSTNDEGKMNLEGFENEIAIPHPERSGTTAQANVLAKKKKSSKSRPYSNCSSLFCCCTWPSCCSRRVDCSCKCLSCPSCSLKLLRWPNCFCCKWPSWSGCCCKPSILPSCRCKSLTWSSCCSKCHFPNCSLAFCFSWKNAQKILCCFSSKSLTNGGKK